MNREEILEIIKSLSKSQGTYTRLYTYLINMRDNNPEMYEATMSSLEKQCFEDAVELIEFIER